MHGSTPANWTRERWSVCEALLDQLLDLPPRERERHLETSCGDPWIRAGVRSLLESLEQKDDVLGDSIVQCAPELLRQWAHETRGTSPETLEPPEEQRRIGPWSLDHPIGRGGMGTVYLAHRADGAFEHRVAVKILRRELDTEEIVRRFESERQILADLNHPHIARLLDGGALPDGRPYLVMEYVEGEPIDAWCDRERLSLDARLELFIRLCDAVSHAHRNSIVHRDLKPSNVLISGDGDPKIVDFGVAKVLGVEGDGETTRTRAPLYTPLYAAPELIRGGPVTAATDVWSLGAVLHLLLAGRPLRQLASLTPGALDRAALDEPAPPSETASTRRTGIAPRSLRGDLDAIVLRAVRPEPGERYATAAELADDVRRFREGRMVLARPPTSWRWVRAFVQHRKVAVVTGSLAAAIAALTLVTAARDTGVPSLEPSRVLVAGFENRSGDPELDDVGLLAADWIAHEFSRTALIRPVLPAMDDRSGGVPSGEDLMRMAERVGAGTALLGRYTLEGDSLAAAAIVLHVPSGEILRTIDRVTAPRSDPSLLVERLRSRATGVMAALVDPRLSAFATSGSSQPPSFEAYRMFARGIELKQKREYRAATDSFHRAAAMDTTFTLPLVYAAWAHKIAIYYPDPTRRDQAQARLADSLISLLRDRRSTLPPWEAAWIDYLSVKDTAALRRVTDMTPEPPLLLMRATALRRSGQPTAALTILSRLDPEHPAPGWNRRYMTELLQSLHLAGRYEREYEVVQEFLRRYPSTRPLPPATPPPELFEIRALAALGRTNEVERRLEELAARALNPYEVQAPLREIRIHGHESLPVVRRTREWYLDQVFANEPTDDPEQLWRWNRAAALRDLGRLEEARIQFEQLLRHASPTSDNIILFLGALGEIAAEQGDRARALQYDHRLRTLDLARFHEPTLIHQVRRERIDIAIALGEHTRAISLLTEGIEAGMPLFMNLHPEMFQLWWLELADDPRYQALVQPG